LDAILSDARARVERLRARRGELERAVTAAPPGRAHTFLRRGAGQVGVIAEVKRRSPSAGAIQDHLDPVPYAQACVAGGAVAISVLTDEVHFGGSLDDLAHVSRAVSVPTLRKDFILDELQLLEARGAGASAVLLIVRALPERRLRALSWEAAHLGLAALVEVHDVNELGIALGAGATLIGVNNRDLDTFTLDLGNAERLLPQVPPSVIAIAESGIEQRGQVERMAAAGADFVLVGSAIAGSTAPEASVRELVGVSRVERKQS
jgi:indole-3-glycerol phosphate synthase